MIRPIILHYTDNFTIVRIGLFYWMYIVHCVYQSSFWLLYEIKPPFIRTLGSADYIFKV